MHFRKSNKKLNNIQRLLLICVLRMIVYIKYKVQYRKCRSHHMQILCNYD
jgi:hypothetical protein